MVEPKVPLKKKDQVALDEEMARNLEAQLQAELIEEERLARQKEEEANIALIESWDNTQAMMEADFELAQRLQAEEQGEITIEERSRLFVELMNRRKKHFAKLRAEEIRRKPPTKAQKRNQMSTYLKNMAGYKHSQLKSKSYDEIQKLFDKEMKRVNTFVDMNSEVVKGSETRTEESSKRAGDELESDMSKKQKIDEHVEVEKDDQEEAEMKRHIEIVKDDEVAIDAIPLATKPPVIVEYKIDKDGRMGYFKLIRADGSSKSYYCSDERLMILKAKLNNDEPWYADYINYIVGKIIPPNWTPEKRRIFFSQVKCYFWDEPYVFKLCSNNVMRRCVAGNEIFEILAHCHSGPTGGHHSASITRRKVYESGFYWPSIFKDAKDYVMKCDACQRSGNISSRSEIPQNNIQIEHDAYWALKQCNIDLIAAAKNRFMELNELMELRDEAYENTRFTKNEQRNGMTLGFEEIKISKKEIRVLYKVEDIATCLVKYVKFWDDWEVDRYGNANL
ncbi:reverse transcriptase domain-containing protein, partial [Tanacetum coccineum]